MTRNCSPLTAGLLLLFSAAVCAAATTHFGEMRVSVPGTMKACKADSECIQVDTLCSACCGYDAINTNYLSAYVRLQRKECQQWRGGFICDCTSGKAVPVCEKGMCRLGKSD